MIFANGDCYITYQQEGLIDEDVRKNIENEFLEKEHQYLNELITTEQTLTFRYSPIKVMESHNTIEPCDLVMDEVQRFLSGMEFSI